MAKRKTKQQREAEQKEALRQRICDIVSGACGRDMSDSELEYVDLDNLGRVVGALTARLCEHDEGGELVCKHFQAHWNMEHYWSVDTILDYYWNHGIRA